MFPFTSHTPKKQQPQTTPPPPITLNLPKSWNHLDTPQLEFICAQLIDVAKTYTETGVDTTTKAIAACFFHLAGIEPLSAMQTDDDGTQYFEAQYTDPEKREQTQTYDGKFIPIRITMSEMLALTTGWDEWDEKHNKPRHISGALEWINKPSDLTNFPYPLLTLTATAVNGSTTAPVPEALASGPKVTFEGPAPLMDGTTWRQYRFSAELMGDAMQQENLRARMLQHPDKVTPERLAQQETLCKECRARFLANVFNRKVAHINPETGQRETSYFYVSSQCTDNMRYFMDITEVQFQAIAMWWQGMMKYLSRQYPKVFRSGKPDSRPSDPLSIYTRSTTTMIKYTGGSEEDVNNTTYTIILQHINDMADENDRVKEMQQKYKH